MNTVETESDLFVEQLWCFIEQRDEPWHTGTTHDVKPYSRTGEFWLVWSHLILSKEDENGPESIFPPPPPEFSFFCQSQIKKDDPVSITYH